jgi:hypothetical protein
MTKTSVRRKRPTSPDPLRRGYRFDYRHAEPNPFAHEMWATLVTVVVEPDVAAVLIGSTTAAPSPNRFVQEISKPIVTVILERDEAGVFKSLKAVNALLRSVIAQCRGGSDTRAEAHPGSPKQRRSRDAIGVHLPALKPCEVFQALKTASFLCIKSRRIKRKDKSRRCHPEPAADLGLTIR